MYYFSVGEDVIKKYRVIFSVDSLRNIEKDLIKDCNIERCNCYMTYGLPHRSVGINYKKFEYEKIGVKEDFYGDLDIYEVNTIELIKLTQCEMESYKKEFMTKLPKIYSDELLDSLFFEVYTRINYIEDKCSVTRQTAATYLNSLVDAGLLEFEKVGRESIYKNTRLINLLSKF